MSRFYAEHIFPHFMEWTLGTRRVQEHRQEALKSLHGEVLEIGVGTGLNLPHYPNSVTWLTVLDPVTLLPKKVAKRIAAVSIPVQVIHLSAELLPFEDCRFDGVVSTWTLCTIPDAVAALREVRRVLKPEGRYVFLEHGRSDEARVAWWQDVFNPLQQRIGCGCNLNRQIDRLIKDAGLRIAKLDRFLMPGMPRLVGEMYRGFATR